MKLEEQNVLLFARTMGQGGTENVVLQICEILKPEVNKVIVCSSGGVNVKKLNQLGIKHYTIPDITNKSPQNVLKVIFRINQIVKKEKISIIHSHHRMAAFYAKIIRNNKIIRISTAHNIFNDKLRFTNFSYRGSNIIAVGLGVAENLINDFKIPKENVTIIFNSVKAFSSPISLIEDFVEEKRRGKILIGNVGRLSRQKGMEYFIQAARTVHTLNPLTKFYIIGDGEDEKYLKKLANDLIENGVLSFMGYISNVQNVISQLDFTVLSSLWEGFPLTPIESFSVGKAIVGTDIPGTNEIIKDGINGLLVQRGDAEDLSEKMNVLINDRSLREKLNSSAQITFEKNFSFNKFHDSIIKYYKGIINEGNKR